MKIYLAGGIFTIGDELRNTLWAKRIRDALPGVDLYSPIENTDINGKEGKKKNRLTLEEFSTMIILTY